MPASNARAGVGTNQESVRRHNLGTLLETLAAPDTSMSALADHEKLLLLYYHVEGLKLREIARLVEESASPLRRWLDNTPREWGFRSENMITPVRGAALPMGFNRQPHYTKGLLLVGADDIDRETFESSMSILVKHRSDIDLVAERVAVKLGETDVHNRS